MKYTAFLYVAGYCTNPDGDCLGIKPYIESLPHMFPNIEHFACTAWNTVTPEWILSNSPVNGNTILAMHSYGCAGAKIALDNLGKKRIIDLAIFLDPVPRFFWGQLRLPFSRWKIPDNINRAIQLYQHNFPPTGFPFKIDNRLTSMDVTNWEMGLQHNDIPGSVTVQAAITKELIKLLGD